MPEEEKFNLGFTDKGEQEETNEYQMLLKNYEIIDGKINKAPTNKEQKIVNIEWAHNEIEQMNKELNEIMIGVHNSNVIYLRLLVIEIIMMLISLCSIVSSMVYYETNYVNISESVEKDVDKINSSLGYDNNFLTFVVLSFNSFSTFFLNGLISSGYWKDIAFEWFIALLHPNMGLLNLTFTIEMIETGETVNLIYRVNDILVIFVFLRVYFILKYFLSLSIYKTSRAARICRMFGEKIRDIFAIRSFFQDSPIKFLLSLYIYWIFYFSYSLRITERIFIVPPIAKHLKIYYPNFNDISNCLWCIFITMMTVGFGDYYPITFLGKVIIYLAAFIGVILNSLVTVAFFKSLEFTANENKVFILLERLRIGHKIENLNKQIVQLIMYKFVIQCKIKKSTDLFEKSKLNKILEELNIKVKSHLKLVIQIRKHKLNISTSNYLLETVVDDFKSIAKEFEEIGKKIDSMSLKMEITNKYDKNMINFIKINLENQLFEESKKPSTFSLITAFKI